MNTIYNQLKVSPFMEKKIILLMLTALFSMFANAQQISYIKADGAWYQVYDEAGKKVTTLSKNSIGEVVGWGSDFFVAVDGAWVKTYDINGKRLEQGKEQLLSDLGFVFHDKTGTYRKAI